MILHLYLYRFIYYVKFFLIKSKTCIPIITYIGVLKLFNIGYKSVGRDVLLRHTMG